MMECIKNANFLAQATPIFVKIKVHTLKINLYFLRIICLYLGIIIESVDYK